MISAHIIIFRCVFMKINNKNFDILFTKHFADKYFKQKK